MVNCLGRGVGCGGGEFTGPVSAPGRGASAEGAGANVVPVGPLYFAGFRAAVGGAYGARRFGQSGGWPVIFLPLLKNSPHGGSNPT